MTDRRKGYSEQNKQAWDALYAGNAGTVWGNQPIPFVGDFLEGLASELEESSKLLDAAAGEGRHLPVLSELPGRVYATDASPHALQKMSGVPGEFESVLCDLECTPFQDDFFDLVLLIDTVETLPNVEEALRELFRVLRPGGRLVCNIPGKEDGISSEDMEDTAVDADQAYLYQGVYFYRFYSEGEAMELIRQCGFEVLRNEVRTWREKAHPGFRNYGHTHTSRIFLLAKPES